MERVPPQSERPSWTRPGERDFERVTLPERDCDLLRDLLIAEGFPPVLNRRHKLLSAGQPPSADKLELLLVTAVPTTLLAQRGVPGSKHP